LKGLEKEVLNEIKNTIQNLKRPRYDRGDEFIYYTADIDYEKDRIPSWNALSPFLHKRKHFEHEREVRALTVVPMKDSVKKGLFIPTNLNILIDKIYVSPFSEKSLIESIDRILSDHKISKELRNSALDTKPIF